jgi:hypothetical protein
VAHEFRSSNLSVSYTSSFPVTLKVKLSLVPAHALSAEAATKSGYCVPFRVVKTIVISSLGLGWVVMFAKMGSDDVQ